MKLKICLGLCLLTMLGGAGRLGAQISSLQFISTNYWNLQSRQGMPISTLIDTNIGSNGRLPLTNSSGVTYPVPNTNTTQFAEMLSFGAVTATTNNAALSVNNVYLQGTSNFNGTVAQAMQLPVGLNPDKSVRLVLKLARIGAPYVSQPVSYNFGSVIPPPTSDYTGTNNNVPLSYWRAIPILSTNAANNFFYYSTNAGAVFATQPGPVSITWVSTATYTAATLPPYTNQLGLAGSPNYITNSDGTFSLLFTANYLVSPNPVKTPKKIYWTQGAFQSLSHPVSVPVGQISSINVVFNTAFPQFVTNSYSVNNGITNAQTLWFDSALHFIFANAQEGRVFMELLGQPNGNGSSEYLGFELVDVVKTPTPSVVTNYLGTPLTPYQDATLGGDLNIAPIPNVGSQFYYNFNGTTYYADRETTNLTDLQVYWTVTGVAGLQWPYLFNRYALVWPSDSTQYSYYLRPAAASQTQAALTAVQLDPIETPSLDWYDALDQPRAFMTPTFKFYSWLTNTYPAQRALLRFNGNSTVRFERVLSFLSAAVQDTSLLGNSVFTNLDSFANYLNYPIALSNYNAYLSKVAAYNNYVNYTNYLAARSRGVNGGWTFFTGYNGPSGPAGSFGSWALDVVSQATVGGPLVTNEFAGSGFSFPTNSYGYTSANVTGITNAVTAVLLKMNGVTNANPANMFVYVYSPNTQFYIFYVPGATNPATNVNLIFNDQAASPLTTSFVSGSYRPSYSPMDSLLLPAVTPVTAPAQPYVTSLPAVVTAPVPVLSPWPSQLATSGLVQGNVNVGDRIVAPPGEIGSTNGTPYLAGYVNTNVSSSLLSSVNIGTSYDPVAYSDPFINGFGRGNAGAIIPVNAIPGQNHLEVWWFRPNNADSAAGFQTIYWPCVIGDYTIKWPTGGPAIVLAGNKGSGPLDSLHAAGSIYYQNDPTKPGYNPNEEHALMLAGQAFALRDDLNITNAPATNYSSMPFVLLAYQEADGRPAMTAYQVLRENPAAGIYFDYIITAGTMLQAPMPLPLMAPPVTANTNYASGVTNYDTEPGATFGDLPTGWTSAAASGPFSLYPSFTFQDRKNNFWVYRGLNSGLPPLQAGKYNPANNTFGPLPDAMGVVNSNFQYFIHVSRQLASLTIGMDDLPPGLLTQEDTTNGLTITGIPTTAGVYPVTINLTDGADGSQVTLPLNITVGTAPGPNTVNGPLVITATNIYTHQLNTFTNRPPALGQAVSASNCFTMRFYYKTLPGFAWPGIPVQTNWPAVGSIVPYLRPLTNGVFAGDPTSSNTPSLDIVYRPVWPELGPNRLPLPTLAQGQTLTTAVNGMTAIRSQDSVQILYQQSIATNPVLTSAACSVVLFDPTVQKKSQWWTNSLPASVLTDPYNGLFFFPNLPPNLISRVWFDPNTTNLVFTGQFVSDPVNGDYVMLNVLRGDDLAAVNNLCPVADSLNHPLWTNMVAHLSRPEYTFYQNPAQPGSYVVNNTPGVTVTNYAGDIVEVTNADTAVDSLALSAVGPGQGYVSYVVANDGKPSHAGDPISIQIVRTAPPLFQGALVVVNSANASPFSQLITFQHTADLAGRTSQYMYDWRIEPPVNGQPPPLYTEDSWTQLSQNPGGPVYTLGSAGILGLTDNYVSMRYGYYATNSGVITTNWSPWANPILAPGWIKRVTQALDPVAGRTQDLYNNAAFTTASIIQLAGTRWNGDVPLNAGSLTNSGLIQLYETVLHVGESLTINSSPPINYGPANQALLLASGYLNDLYMTLGNAAWANSLNPTIGFGTDNTTYGSVATASFCFEGEEPTLLEQNLALLRGRDDSLSPGVLLPPAYNRLYWNYTYGLDAGQVIYALNYNITDQNGDGKVDASDAQIMFPQGHGDAYGHYLTAMMNYYELLMNPNFDWVPQAETVLVLGAAVTVNYQNETKFAAAAGAVARTGRQIFELTWRENYHPGTTAGWGYFASNHVGQYTYVDNNSNTQHVTRYWGMDHWASRVGQGTYLNWVVANSILPYKDNNPNDQGVQIVDRTTVQDLQELPATAAALEADMDNANAGFTPLGLAQNAIPFDINPQQVTGANPQTHFEQIYARAVQALNNAVVAFNAAQNVTQNLRQEQNSLSDLQAAVSAQELAYNDQLIELYGTPYPDDVGPGATYPDGYTGPDLLHYMYVDNVATNTYGGILADPTTNDTFNVDIQNFPPNWYTSVFQNFNFITNSTDPNYTNPAFSDYITFNIGPDGFSKPPSWAAGRTSVGSIQNAQGAVNAAIDSLRVACYNAVFDKQSLDEAAMVFNAQTILNYQDLALQQNITATSQYVNDVQTGFNIFDKAINNAITLENNLISEIGGAIPDTVIAGLADGGDFLAPFKFVAEIPVNIIEILAFTADSIAYGVTAGIANTSQNDILTYQQEIATNQFYISLQNAVQSLGQQENKIQGDLLTINQAETALNGAQANYRTLVAQGNRIQMERLTFRRHAAAQVQGYTVTDAAFLVFQNEDLERYTTLFNLAAQYAYMAANAYDYETGLLGTPAGQSFLNQIISSSALGVIQNGRPQISGSGLGDPGLANALAEMKADWDVIKGRLGFNNPDGYGTTVSLRTENYRIQAGTAGDTGWKQLLQQSVLPDLRADTDVKNNCLQIDDGSGQAVPGIELGFSTTITDGQNLFGQPLGPGDHNFSATSFATKIFSVGVCFDGYVGMDNPNSTGGITPPDPTLDPNGLAATPYVYLIPCGADSMRSPPLGDTSTIRTWNVDDVAIPLPFNIGASAFSSAPFYTSADSLSEPLFGVRKMQAFRPVSTTAVFNTSIYGANGAFQPSQYTNQRLIGRSIWNSKWKLIIPGKNLLSNPSQGLTRFINSVKDVHLYFITYSYAGN